MTNRLGEKNDSLLHKSERSSTPSQKINLLGEKLDDFAKLLELYPYDKNGKFQGKLEPTSHKAIQPVLIICPNSAFCVTKQCKQRSLLQHNLSNDVPQVTLIKNTKIYTGVPVLTGSSDENGALSKVYINAAQYMKVGQTLWVDRIFSAAVLNGMYSFHASASAYTEYWNNRNCYGTNTLCIW